MAPDLRPRLIVNADDLGIANGRDDAILDLVRQGVVTSATLMVNGATAEEASRRAAEIVGSDITRSPHSTTFRLGLHLNLSEGPALSGRSSLTDARGNMLGKFRLRQLLDHSGLHADADVSISDTDLRREIRAQIQRFSELTGSLPTHLDGHHHIQVVPRIARLLAPILTREVGIYRIRLPSPEAAEEWRLAWPDDAQTRAFHQQIDIDTPKAAALYRDAGMRSPAASIGRTLMGQRLQATALRQRLGRCRAEAGNPETPLFVELMCHPGRPSSADNRFGQSPKRQVEADFLGSLAFAAASTGWQLTHWADLLRPPAHPSRRILIYSKLHPGTGNATTAARLAAALAGAGEVLFRRLPDQVPGDVLATRREIADLRRMVDEEAIDLVFGIHLYRAGSILCAALAGPGQRTPYLLLAGGTDINHNLQNSAHCAALKDALASAAGLATLTVSQMQALETALPSTLPEHRAVLPGTPDLSTASSYSLRSALGLKVDQTIILLPAGIRPVKDVAFAIEAGAQALIDHPDHILVILGPTLDSDYHAHCRSLIVEWQLRHRALKGRMFMLEALSREDYLAALKETALVLNTSQSEGLSNAILEAMGTGIPVLARDIPGNRQVVRDGETGLLFDGLAHFVRQYRRRFAEPDLASRLIDAGRAEYARHCDPAAERRAAVALVDAALHHRAKG